MATNATWTIVFDDKKIVKKTGVEAGTYYKISDDSFWNQAKFSNIWAIQYGTSVETDEVEYRNENSNSSFAEANIGSFQDFIDKWDAAHLASLQSKWDNDPRPESEKGSRPTSYSS
jgi:hypothetical protein